MLRDVVEDACRQSFCGWYGVVEPFVAVQVGSVKAFYDLATDEGVEVAEVADHPSHAIYIARKRKFDGVVVAVSVRIVALPECGAIIVRGQDRVVQAMRRGEVISAVEAHFQAASP